MNKRPVYQNHLFYSYEFDLDEVDPDVVAKNIQDVLKDIPRSTEDNFRFPGFYTTHSNKRLHKEHPELFKDLIQAIEKRALEVFRDSCSSPKYLAQGSDNTEALSNFPRPIHTEFKPVVHRSWCAQYQKGDKNEWHRHADDVFCYQAVYYADPGDLTPLWFENVEQDSWELDEIVEITPRKGMLLLFTSPLNHMVPEITEDGLRLIFAASLVLVRDNNE